MPADFLFHARLSFPSSEKVNLSSDSRPGVKRWKGDDGASPMKCKRRCGVCLCLKKCVLMLKKGIHKCLRSRVTFLMDTPVLLCLHTAQDLMICLCVAALLWQSSMVPACEKVDVCIRNS